MKWHQLLEYLYTQIYQAHTPAQSETSQWVETVEIKASAP